MLQHRKLHNVFFIQPNYPNMISNKKNILQNHKRKKYVVKHNGWLLNVQISKHRNSENVNEADRHILMRVIVRFVKCKLIQGHDKTACYNKKLREKFHFHFHFYAQLILCKCTSTDYFLILSQRAQLTDAALLSSNYTFNPLCVCVCE